MSTAMVASKPLSCTNATIVPQKPPSHIGNLQPSAAELEKLGIRVRDFAYEKTLPPARTVYLHRAKLREYPILSGWKRRGVEIQIGKYTVHVLYLCR